MALICALFAGACGTYGEVDYFADEPETPGRPNPGVGVGRAEVVLNRCPQLTSLAVTPLVAGVGGIVTIRAAAEDPEGDDVSIEWTATQGEVKPSESGQGGASGVGGNESVGGAGGGPTEEVWTYQCTQIGYPTLTLTISDERGCSLEKSIALSCVAAP
jgi:hypothetical protein